MKAYAFAAERSRAITTTCLLRCIDTQSNIASIHRPNGGGAPPRYTAMADRRAGKVPHVKTAGGGKAPRARNQDGAWRKKRSDTGKKKKKR